MNFDSIEAGLPFSLIPLYNSILDWASKTPAGSVFNFTAQIKSDAIYGATCPVVGLI